MRIRSLFVAVPLVLLAACGGTAEPVAAVNTSPTADVAGPATPAATAVGTATAAEMPTATGAFGEKPTFTFPSETPPPGLQRQVLVEGTGPEVQTGDQLVANYLGEVWGGTTPFDNSYDRGKPSVFPIGVGQVVKGWDVGLVGMKVGSRVLLTLSPSDGYGTTGRAPDITGTDTLVFVIDIVNSLGKTVFGQADAAPQPQDPAGPQVGGDLGAAPTLTIPAGLAEPTEVKTTVIAQGTGAPVVAGDVYAQYGVWDWQGAQQAASWENEGPQSIPVAAETPQLAGLIGIPVGSRVMLQIPADAASGSPASVIVLDLLFQ
ncbi:FKBP-type peptidyl-prolyl cis-trans isomerase [Nakamurella deserti]|uniref:FKBP-type peptidyl-prolyl cis-trans isomerase n=1 Tax=Nakamurella deserti TaxID=2164074 RepID=UPI0013004981|nr:FKBP-type peptidyl-prolyl cis-trans isomerase [Nakamurella deserti]